MQSFSRRASKRRHAQHDSDQEEQEEDIKAAEEEAADELVRLTVLEEVSLRYPVVYDMFNLCDMFKSRQLNQLSLSMLCTICNHFHLYIDHIKGRRKAPHFSILEDLMKTCNRYVSGLV